MDPIVSALVVDLWHTTEAPPGIPRTEQQRQALVEAGIPYLIARASLLRAVAAAVEIQSTEQAIRDRAAGGDIKQAMVGQHLAQAAAVPPHLRAMERSIDDRNRAESVAKAQMAADESAAKVRQLEAAVAAARSSTSGVKDPGPELALAKAKHDYAAALDALASTKAGRI